MFFTEPFKLIYKHRKIIKALTKDDIKKKYAGSFLGIIWLFLYPLLFLAVYMFVFSVVLRVRLGMLTTGEYILLIFSGLLPFLAFSEAMSISTTSITSNSALIKNTLVPIDIMPLKAVLFSQTTQIVGTCLLLLAITVSGKLTLYALLFPFIWAFQVLFSMGAAWFLSSANVYFRDLQTIIPLLILLLMFISPIAYSIDMVPDSLRFIMHVNPLFYFISSYQDIFVFGRLPGVSTFVLLIIIACFVFFIGFWFFSKIKALLADYI